VAPLGGRTNGAEGEETLNEVLEVVERQLVGRRIPVRVDERAVAIQLEATAVISVVPLRAATVSDVANRIYNFSEVLTFIGQNLIDHREARPNERHAL